MGKLRDRSITKRAMKFMKGHTATLLYSVV